MNKRSTGSLVGGLLLGTLIAAMGAFFCYALIRGYKRAMVTRAWVETPCTIVRSEVEETRPTPNSPLSYRPIIRYAYAYEGQPLEDDGIKRIDGPTTHKEKAEAAVAKWPPGDSTCWVNPENPEEAVLMHNTKAVGYTVWFPGLFVIGGIGIIIASLRAHLRKPSA